MDECPSIQNNIGKRNLFHIFRYGANKLIKGPKVLLDRSLVERYFQGEDSEEERRKEAELERKKKKASYYNRMKNRQWKTQSQIFKGQNQSQSPKMSLKEIEASFDKCEYTCGLCGEKFGTDVKLLQHIGSAHKDITTGEYITRFGLEPSKKVEHTCAICKKSMIHTKSKVSCHLQQRHGIGLKVYMEKYLVQSQSPNKSNSASGGQSQRGRPRKALYASGSASAIMEGLLNNKRSPSKNNFNCNICKKPYKYLGALHQHMRRDHGQGPSGKKPHGSFKQNGIDFDKDVVLLDTDGKFKLNLLIPFT